MTDRINWGSKLADVAVGHPAVIGNPTFGNRVSYLILAGREPGGRDQKTSVVLTAKDLTISRGPDGVSDAYAASLDALHAALIAAGATTTDRPVNSKGLKATVYTIDEGKNS